MPPTLSMEEHNRRIMERLERVKDPRLHFKTEEKKNIYKSC